jgi:hypothetical protein
MKTIFLLFIILTILSLTYAQDKINSFNLITLNPVEYEKTEFNINVSAAFNNPYVSSDIQINMILTSPSGKELFLPCFYFSGDSISSLWKARFAAQESGTYSYFFRLSREAGISINSDTSAFAVFPSNKNGFLHINDLWTLKFDSGKLFRGIGENVGWESRSFEDPKWTYNYLLPTLSKNGANYFRTWMCQWNLPLEWQKVSGTNRYKSTQEYYNPGGIKRMDELVNLADSLGLYIQLTLDYGASLSNEHWFDSSSYNRKNPDNAEDFFTFNSSQQKYKDKLRYIVARWGYSTSIAAWEFFNEIDNLAFTRLDSVIIPQEDIIEWHSEMSRFLNGIDPYHHIITTSISHRDIIGLNSLPYIDINQKHIYKRTEEIRPEILRYTKAYNKTYVIGEFGYEWDWNLDFSKITGGLEYDYKRGLWYGLFSPTPILPLTWWWEFFDTNNMTPYFRGVREISDLMLNAGEGSFEIINVYAKTIEAYGLKCGEKLFVYLLNNSNSDILTDIELKVHTKKSLSVQSFIPVSRIYKNLGRSKNTQNGITVTNINLKSKNELVLILSPNKD